MLDGRYVLIERLGAGGMAEVWRARDAATGATVAIKRLHAHLRRDGATLERFRREADLGRRLRHPRVVPVHDARIDADEAYLVMDHVAGGSLADRLALDRTLPALAAVRFARDVAEGLAALHARGIVHRDLTASNIVLDPGDGARLADCGIARATDDPVGVTAVGDVVGTLRTMAPEVLAGDPPTPASDVWSLGAVLYEAVVGRAPFAGVAPGALLAARQTRPAPVDGLPDALNDFLLRALDPDPARRPVDGVRAEADLRVVAERLAIDGASPDDVTREMPLVVAPAAVVEPPASSSAGPLPETPAASGSPVASRPDGGARRAPRAAVLALAAVALFAVAALGAGLLEPNEAGDTTAVPSPEAHESAAPTAPASPAAGPGGGEAEAGKGKAKGANKGKGANNGQGRGRGG